MKILMLLVAFTLGMICYAALEYLAKPKPILIDADVISIGVTDIRIQTEITVSKSDAGE